MPKFNLAPLDDNQAPAWPPAEQAQIKPQRMNAAEAKAYGNERIENAAGPLKPLVQFTNMLASPDVKAGIFTGPINGISKLGNAIGDLVQGKKIDVSDAWTISDKTTRRLNPWRIGTQGQGVTPSDQAGLEFGEGIGAEIAGFATGAALLNKARQLRRLQQAAQALRQSQTVKSAAVAIKASPKLTAATNVARNVGEALVGTTLATPFLDQEDGNLANLGDAIGLKLPGRVEPGQNYLQALGQSIAVEGVAAPLALMGMGSFIKPIREGLAKGDLGVLGEIADAELAPYVPHLQQQAPALPPAAAADVVPTGDRALPARSSADLSFLEAGPATYQWDSAISRSLQEQTQIRQVGEQRQRLQDMGLVQNGEGGQLEFSLDGAVDPEIRLQIRQLQTQRGQLIKQNMDSGADVSQQLGEIDQQIADLTQAGQGADFMPAEQPFQPELDMPDPRPELDTYLANLDELSDQQLREIHSRVWQSEGEQRALQQMETAQQKVVEVTQRIADIQARADAGDVTPVGAKRMLGKAQKELAALQAEVTAIENRRKVPEALVGDQLRLRLGDEQLSLDMAPEIKLPTFQEITRTASEYGYRTPDDYRNALGGWTRDQLRRLAMPQSSPEVAALVKARTGRRVWQAKKQDIIDALVEISERRGRYLPPEAEQLAMELKANDYGDAAPLFDRPADLDVPGMGTVLDADGNEVVVPLTDYSGRGIDAQTREKLKAEILRKAIANGEVQPPVSPLPERPVTQFEQGSLVDDLFADETGQLPLLYANDAVPTYKLGSKNSDALIEEMRMRFEYQVLDEQARRAQQQAYMAAHGWDTLPWEEKKKLGILGEGFYSLQPYSDQFRDPTPQFSDELTPTAPRKPKQYSLTFDEKGNAQVVEQPKAQTNSQSVTGLEDGMRGMAKGLTDGPRQQLFEAFKAGETRLSGVDEPILAAAKKKLDPAKTNKAAFDKFIDAYQQARAKAEAAATKRATNKQVAALSKRQQDLLKQREELLRQSQGAKC